jgi:hypothetical protein
LTNILPVLENVLAGFRLDITLAADRSLVKQLSPDEDPYVLPCPMAGIPRVVAG